MIRGALLCTALAGAAAAQHVPALTHGPLRGHADTQTICVWARASAAGSYALHLQSLVDGSRCTSMSSPRARSSGTTRRRNNR